MTKNIDYKVVYERIDKKTDLIITRIDGISARVGILENWRSNIVGKITVIVAIVGFVVTMFSGWVREKLGI